MGILSRLFAKEDEKEMTLGEALREHAEHRQRVKGWSAGGSLAYTAIDLPSKYDHVKLGGDKVIGGKHCRTVGELKDASLKFYGE